MQVDTTRTRQEYNYSSVRFILTQNKIAVATRLQFFVLEPAAPYCWKRMRTIRNLIAERQIKDISDLAGYCTGAVIWNSSREDWL